MHAVSSRNMYSEQGFDARIGPDCGHVCQSLMVVWNWIPGSAEAHAANMYKNAVVEAGDTDTTRTRCYSGKPMRCRTNDYINDWESRPQDIQPFPQQAIHSTRTGVIGGIGGITDEAKLNTDTSCFAMGQSAGGVRKVQPVAEIVADIMRDAEASIERMNGLRLRAPA